MLLGEEIYLKIGDPETNKMLGEIFLKYMVTDKSGFKMKGRFPSFWRMEERELIGPALFNNGYIFKAVDIDYRRNLIWLREITSPSNRTSQFETEPFILEGLVGLTI